MLGRGVEPQKYIVDGRGAILEKNWHFLKMSAFLQTSLSTLKRAERHPL